MAIDWTQIETPEMKFEKAKAAKRSEIGMAFKAHITGYITTTLGDDMQFNESDSLKLEGAIKLKKIAPDSEAYLTNAHNQTRYNVTLAELEKTQIEMLAAFGLAHRRKQERIAAVNNATTQADLDAIEW